VGVGVSERLSLITFLEITIPFDNMMKAKDPIFKKMDIDT
jgi:hypothetical protein